MYKSISVYEPEDLSPPIRALISLSRGGADACVIREFDLVKKEFVDKSEAFYIPEAKSSISWLSEDSLLVS